ncbi:Protein N-acetyltransferase, RimJ/RimL family [Actinomadura meyerae]|uniref:Protein N-acetyltransferase, RimJ/RimL family n=1 Tax=Actinomadura meyerae TaxID=240840 RepID=A0A239NSX7_9ACTN|nr:GNAT family protein [Actinomadura meyerae]SNT57802.1 Protein N-acetyltransferase, RimJ/RimL family [Actinomadura meyerae]
MNGFEGDVRLTGERLVLRPFGLEDAATLIEVIRAGEDFLPPNFPTVLEAEPLAWFLRTGVHNIQNLGLGIHLAVTERCTGDLVGTIGLFKVDWAQLTCEVGYGMRPGARGRGHATEALGLITEWALRDRGLFRVELRAMVTNHASIRVAEKGGYVREGIARGAERDADGVNRDMIVFSRIATDPPPRGAPPSRPGGASARLGADDEEGRQQ